MNFARNCVFLFAVAIAVTPAFGQSEGLRYPGPAISGPANEMPSHLGQYGIRGQVIRSLPASEPLQPEVDQLRPRPQTLVARRLDAIAAEASGKGKAADAESGVFASVDYLHWTLRRRDQDYAITSEPGAIVISGGEVHELEYAGAPGVRTLMGYQGANGWKIGVGYMMYDTESQGSAEDGLGTLYATRSHPDLNRRAGVATATSSLDMNMLDLEVQNTLTLGNRAELTLLGSFRWADVGQGFNVEYQGIDFPVGGVVDSRADTSGFGLRIGANGRCELSDRIYLVAGAETSLLHATTNISLVETAGSTQIVDVSDAYSQVLPGLGAHAGAGVQWGQVQIELGYEMQAWFDLGDRMSFLDDQHLGIFSHSNHNLLMDGFYLRLGWDH